MTDAAQEDGCWKALLGFMLALFLFGCSVGWFAHGCAT
jgi:hypothetical protein